MTEASLFQADMAKGGALHAARILIEASSWFEITPLPDDNYRVRVKDEYHPARTVRSLSLDYPPNPETEEAG